MSNVLRRFTFRSPRLYERIVELALEGGEDGAGWVEVVVKADPENEWAERTVEGAIRDLVVLGMCAVSGQPARGRRPEPRRVRVTPLGAAALEGEVGPVPWR